MEDKKIKKKKTDNSYRKDAEWLELCHWIELNIFGYEANQHIQSKNACLVLKGLQTGKNTANNNIDDNGYYPFSIILMTFKANKIQILNAIKGKTFDSEERKMRYVCAIVRDKINDIYCRWTAAQKSTEKIESLNTDVMEYDGAEYKSQHKRSDISKFNDLW